MRTLTYLPDTITEKGTTFVNTFTHDIKKEIENCKRDKKKYRFVKVLQRSLRGKPDLYGKPYKPTEWLFRER